MSWSKLRSKSLRRISSLMVDSACQGDSPCFALFAASISTAVRTRSPIDVLKSRTLSICRNAEPTPLVPVYMAMLNFRLVSSTLRARRLVRNITEPISRSIQAFQVRPRTGSDGVWMGTDRDRAWRRWRLRRALASLFCSAVRVRFVDSFSSSSF